MKHIYYKNDFAVEITLLNASGEVVSPPDWQWHIEFTDGRRKYICSVDKGNANVVGNTIMCYLDNHKFCCGEIGYKFVQAIPDLNYLDGFQNLITPKALPIELWEQESDNDVNIQSSVVPAYVVYDAYMTAKENGYTGTAEEFYDALNHIVDIDKKEAERVEAEANRVTAEQQRADNFVAMESALTTATNQATTATKRANDISADLEAKREADYWRGAKGEKGGDGVSPTVKTSKTGKVTTIEITDANGVHTATVNDGESVEIVQSTGTSETAVMSQKAVSDALSNVYTKAESDAMLATKQNVLTAGNGITIADNVISVDAIPVDDKKFTVWSNPRIDEFVTTFENYGYNDDGTQKTSGSSTRSWVFRIGNYGHKKVYFNLMNAWMCDGLDDAQNMTNPTLLGKNSGNVNIGEEHIGKYIVAMSFYDYPNLLGTPYGRCVQFCDEKTQAELDADERMLSDMYAGNLMRYAVATSAISDTPTLEWGDGANIYNDNKRNILLNIVSRPNIAYECKVMKGLKCLYQGCGRLREIIPLWDTSLVKTMLCAFNTCLSLERADLSHLNLSSVTDVSYMFYKCIVLKEVKMASLQSATNCSSMFESCSSLQSVTLPELPSVTNCANMFRSCSSLQSLYLDMPNCDNFNFFAYQCNALHTVEIVDVRKATNLSSSFIGCTSLHNVTCVEELPKCVISFQSSSKLTLDSVTNIITHLPDLSAENSKTLTLHATTKSLLTESLIAEATNKNWIIA